jgi:hypothetical protein
MVAHSVAENAMRLPAHLKRSRHGIYYFRLVLPFPSRAFFGLKREIRRSLGTREPDQAKLAACLWLPRRPAPPPRY